MATLTRWRSYRTQRHADANRLTKLGVLVTIVVVLAGSAAQLVNYGFFHQRFPGLDPGSDGGVLGVTGDLALASAAVAAWVLTVRVRSARPAAGPLAVLLTFLAADQVTRLHEHIPHWLAFYLPVLAASFICLAAIARGSQGPPRFRSERGAGHDAGRLIGVGLLSLALSFTLHVFGPRLLLDFGVSDTTGWAYETKAAVKHGTEIAGWLLIAIGLLRLGLPRGGHPHAVKDPVRFPTQAEGA